MRAVCGVGIVATLQHCHAALRVLWRAFLKSHAGAIRTVLHCDLLAGRPETAAQRQGKRRRKHKLQFHVRNCLPLADGLASHRSSIGYLRRRFHRAALPRGRSEPTANVRQKFAKECHRPRGAVLEVIADEGRNLTDQTDLNEVRDRCYLGGRGGRMLSGGGKTSAPKHALNHELGPTIRGWRGEGKTSQESMLLRSRSSRNLALNFIRPAGI